MDLYCQSSWILLLVHQQLAPEPLAGNFITADAVTWSVISIIGLLGGTGLILYFFDRYDWLGWSEAETKPVQFRPVDQVAVTPAQRAIVWFLFVSSLLFVLQTLTGGLIAHYHVQLAIFWVSASYLATGIFIVPLIAGRERAGQGALTIALLIAVAMVVFGSLAGEYIGARGWLGEGLWFWVGHQGWEYLDLAGSGRSCSSSVFSFGCSFYSRAARDFARAVL